MLGLAAGNFRGSISFGQRSVDANFFTAAGVSPRVMGCGQDVLKALGLKNGIRLRAAWDESRSRLRLGPVVAIMVWRYQLAPSAHLFGAANDMARVFVRLARRRGVVAYAFSPQDIDWENNSTIGYVPVKGRWRRVVVPLPDVIYDRIQTRSLDASRRVQRVKQRFLSMESVHYFNPCFLDKWETYEALAQDSATKRYLPKTEQFTILEQAGAWLRRYRTIYIKPSRGSLGLGIIKITKTARGFRYHRIRMGGGSRAGFCESLPKLERCLRTILPRRSLIIQQGLHLARYGGRPYDIRIMVQKTPRNNWVCTNMIARVAPAGSAVSNVAEGGTMISVRRAVRGSLRINAAAAARRVRRAAKLVAQMLETSLGQAFGEFGVDMAFDQRGRLWLIEVNAKPGRQSDNQPGIPPSMRRITRYAIAKARLSG